MQTEYGNYDDVELVHELLQKYGYQELAKEVKELKGMDYAVKIVINEAKKRNDYDAINNLYFANLIYS